MAGNDLEHALRPYLETTPPRQLEEILAVLKRHNAPWVCGAGAVAAIDPTASAESIPDFCTGEENVFGPPLPHLERIPFLYRLHSLHQLSTVSATTHFGARHTRLSHSIGAVGMAHLIITTLLSTRFEETSSIVQDAYSALGDDIVQKACLGYCALHDAFHGPFGHSLDIMKDVLGAGHGEKLDDKYLREGLTAALESGPDAIGRQLRLAASLWVGEEQASELLQLILLISRQTELRGDNKHLFFLHQIVSSLVDADRLDYVVRDGLYLEAKDYSASYRALVKSIRIVEWPPARQQRQAGEVEEEEPRACLAFASKYEDAAALLLGKRRDYYTLYYEKAEKLVVDDMICHALAYILDDKDVPDRAAPKREDIVGEIRRNIMLLTDESFIPALLDLKARPECYDLLFRFIQRHYFQIITSVSVRLDEVIETKNAVKLWVDQVEAFLEEKADRAGVRYAAAKLISPEYVEEARAAFAGAFRSAVTQSSSELPEREKKILSFGFQYWVQSVFRQRQQFEERVWARLTDGDRYLNELHVAAEKEFGDAALVDRFQQWPPLHVTTSSFFAMLDKRDVLLQRKEGQPSEDLLFYDLDHPERIGTRSVTPAAKEDRPAYPLVLSALPSIVSQIGSEAIERAFWDELLTFEWLVGALS